MTRIIKNVLFFMDKKREMDVFNNGGRFHENKEPLCL